MTPSQKIRIGIDTGGTFTDLVLLDAAGLHIHKLRSTPDDPSRAILAGIAHLSDLPAEVTHGSTVATNAVLERKGARVAFVTTAGFEDILLIGRQTRAELYNFQVRAPRPLIEPGLTFGTQERLAADGTVLEPLTEEEITRILAALHHAKPDSVAVCLLHSYANPAHEQALTQAIAAAGFPVSASHAILPEYREFERFSTTAVNAYVTPLMSSYLTRLEAGLATPKPPADPSSPSSSADPCPLIPGPCLPIPDPCPLRIMQSNGGSISAAHASRAAVQTILSGPAAGVVGAQALAAVSGYTRIITFDMGGTSTDVALIDEVIGTTSDSIVGDFPVRLPVLDIHTVGAGGGSIAYLDTGGSLRVGPRSAGANPGPACYGRGDQLTVTDANLLLGRLDPAYFLGGRMQLDLDRPARLAQTLADQLNLTPQALAEGILRIANANMERAIRVVSVQRGHDPRDFALLAFGGAGGLHACALAESLEMTTVVIPRYSGVLSALGMLLADVSKDYSRSILQPTAQLTPEALQHLLVPLLDQARQDLTAEGFTPATTTLLASLDMRYQGQAYELSIPLTPTFAEAFHQRHQQLYGYANAGRSTEIVQLRLKATGVTSKPELPTQPAPATPPPSPSGIRQTIFDNHPHPTPIYHREALTPGMQASGPAILLTGESTNIIPPDWHWRIDEAGTLIATHTPRPPLALEPPLTPKPPSS